MQFMQTAEFGSLIGPLAKLGAISEIMAAAVAEIPDSVDVVDPTGRIGLTVRSDGGIENFQIIGGWRETIGPARLGDAITDLINTGRTRLLEAMNSSIDQNWGEAIDNGWLSGRGVGPEQDAAMRDAVEDSAAQIIQAAHSQGPIIPEQAFERAADLFERMDESRRLLDEAEDASRSVVDEADVEDVACEFSNGAVSRVLVNPMWARKTPIVGIRQRVIEEISSPNGGQASIGLGQSESAQVVLDMIQVLHAISSN